MPEETQDMPKVWNERWYERRLIIVLFHTKKSVDTKGNKDHGTQRERYGNQVRRFDNHDEQYVAVNFNCRKYNSEVDTGRVCNKIRRL